MSAPVLLGLHHLTAVCADAARTARFYTSVLGLRLVKRTVNFDDPGSYHLYLGDTTGTPGTLVTFFEWAHLPKGKWGIGATHHLALAVETPEAQLKWKRRLTDLGVHVTGPYDRTYFHSIYFTDPDGLILEIATRGPGWAVDEDPAHLGERDIMPALERTKFGRNEEAIAARTWPEPVGEVSADMRLAGLHHVTAIASDIGATDAFYAGVLGFRRVKKTVNYDDPASPHLYYGIGEGAPGTIMTYFGYPHGSMREGEVGPGLTHHVAFAAADEEVQLAWRDALLRANVPVSPVMDRIYFRSIYFQDPDGHVLEIATLGPGFLADEPESALGESLKLPPWLERRRGEIEKTLAPFTL
jgi:glyoxalase family protein